MQKHESWIYHTDAVRMEHDAGLGQGLCKPTPTLTLTDSKTGAIQTSSRKQHMHVKEKPEAMCNVSRIIYNTIFGCLKDTDPASET